MRRGDKTVRGRDDLARNTQRLKRGNKRERPIREQAQVPHAEIFAERPLQLPVVMTVVREPPALPNVLKAFLKFLEIRQERRCDGDCFFGGVHFHLSLLMRSFCTYVFIIMHFFMYNPVDNTQQVFKTIDVEKF